MNRFNKLLAANKDIIVQNIERRRGEKKYCEDDKQAPNAVFNSSPVFVLSTGRCGTELITKAIKRCGSSVVYHKPNPELLFLDRWAYENHREKRSEIRSAFLSARFELVLDSCVRNRRYIETNFRTTFFAYAAKELFPNAKFIHLYRNPYDFIKSATRLGYYNGIFTDMGRIVPVSGRDKKKWKAWSRSHKAAWLWNETNQFIEKFKLTLDPDDFIEISSELLFSSSDEIKKIITFCELPVPNKSVMEKIISKPVNQKKTSDKELQILPDEIRSLIPLSKEYGYEKF
jgi:hypothetical protein